MSVHSEVKDIFNKTLQAAIDASKLSSLSDASLAGYVQQIVSEIVTHIPYHWEDDTNLNQVEKIMTDICKNYHSFDTQIFKDAVKNFTDNIGNISNHLFKKHKIYSLHNIKIFI